MYRVDVKFTLHLPIHVDEYTKLMFLIEKAGVTGYTATFDYNILKTHVRTLVFLNYPKPQLGLLEGIIIGFTRYNPDMKTLRTFRETT